MAGKIYLTSKNERLLVLAEAGRYFTVKEVVRQPVVALGTLFDQVELLRRPGTQRGERPDFRGSTYGLLLRGWGILSVPWRST
jgi:hypothetical protein